MSEDFFDKMWPGGIAGLLTWFLGYIYIMYLIQE
jgi:hypothetical protein